MRLVVADTSPLRYLLQIEQIDLLPRLKQSDGDRRLLAFVQRV